MRGNLHRPYGFGRNGTVFGVAPPHNVEALVPRRSPKSGTVALRNLVTLSLAGTTSSLRPCCTSISIEALPFPAYPARRSFTLENQKLGLVLNSLVFSWAGFSSS